jgi:cyclase
MSLTKRIIPCLDTAYGKVVKGIHFKNLRDAGNPVELAKYYCNEGADEIVFLDITASIEKRKTLKDMVSKVAYELTIPFTVGGGIRSLEDARIVLCNGADKVSINTAAIENPKLIMKLSKVFGKQCIVVAIDAKRRYDLYKGKTIVKTKEGKCWFEVYIYGGSKPTGIDAIKWAEKASKLGAGELLVTSIDRDGTKMGYDLDLIKEITERVNIPVIASGGAGELKHILDAFKIAKADAALAASIFHYGIYKIKFIKEFLFERGVPVRLERD